MHTQATLILCLSYIHCVQGFVEHLRRQETEGIHSTIFTSTVTSANSTDSLPGSVTSSASFPANLRKQPRQQTLQSDYAMKRLKTFSKPSPTLSFETASLDCEETRVGENNIPNIDEKHLQHNLFWYIQYLSSVYTARPTWTCFYA